MKKNNAARAIVPIMALALTVSSCSLWQQGPSVATQTKASALSGKNSVAKTVIKYKLPKKKSLKTGRSIASAIEGLTPNSIRYRENGKKPETGKSGGRKLQTWALQDKAGLTSVYISTGDVKQGTTEDGTMITKVSFKGVDSAGATVLNQQHNHLENDGSVVLTTDELIRHQSFSIQTHISKEGSKRNYVVKTTNRVHLLPDPSVITLNSQNEVLVGQELVIDAFVRELNSDTGVAGDCVLYVDAAEVQRIDNVWVDAGDEIGCHFSNAFDSAGEKNIRVAFEGSNPSDWDEANNSMEKQVTVKSANATFDYINLYFSDNFHKDIYRYKNSYGQTYSHGSEYRSQQMYFNGTSYDSSGNIEAGPVSLSVVESSGNNSLETVANEDLSGYCYSHGGISVSCYRYDYAKNIYMSYYKASYGYSSVSYQRYGSKAIYHNGGYYSGGFAEDCEEEGSCYEYSYGTVLPISGNDYSIRVDVQSSSGNLLFEKNFVLKGDSYYYSNQPWSCGRGGQYCDEREYGYSYQNCYYSGDPENAECR